MKQSSYFSYLIFLFIVFFCQAQYLSAQRAAESMNISLKAAQTVALSGYTQVRFQCREEKPDGFDIRRSRLTLKGKLGRRMNYKLQMDFGGSSQKLLDAELGYRISELLTVSAGQFKIPFSIENLASSARLATINRSQVVEGLCARSKDIQGNQSGRDIGIIFRGKFKIIDYAWAFLNGSGINSVDQNDGKAIVGRVVLHPLNSLTIGCSYYQERTTQPNNEDFAVRNRLGAEITWFMKNIYLSAEYIRGTDDVIEKSGWYVQPEYEILSKRLYAVIKYDIFDADLALPDNIVSLITAGCTVALYDRCKIQLNYQLKSEDIEISNHVLVVQVQYGF